MEFSRERREGGAHRSEDTPIFRGEIAESFRVELHNQCSSALDRLLHARIFCKVQRFTNVVESCAVGVENFNWSVLLGSFVNALVIAGIQTAYVHISPAFIIHREFKAEEPPPYVQELFVLILLLTLPPTSYCSDWASSTTSSDRQPEEFICPPGASMAKEDGAPSAAEKGKGKMDIDKPLDTGKKPDDKKKDKDGKLLVKGKKGDEPQEGTELLVLCYCDVLKLYD
jgi:hypothetical protein